MSENDHCFFSGCSSDRRNGMSSKQTILTLNLSKLKLYIIFARQKSSSHFGRMNTLDRDYLYWQILSLVCPTEKENKWHCFFPINPKARVKMADIVNKGYYYSFKIFPRFWLAKNTRLINHNQLLMTKFGRFLSLARKWRQKCSVLAG